MMRSSGQPRSALASYHGAARALGGAALVSCSLFLAQLGAQDPADPFGKAGGGAGAPAGKAPPPVAAPSSNVPLAVKQIRDSNPRSAADLMQAAEAVYRFRLPAESRMYLLKLVNLKADDATLAPLLRRFGDKWMLELRMDPELQPEGAQVAELVLAAAQRVAVDPARIDHALKQLGSDNPITTTQAVTQLEEAGLAAIGPALRVLADAGRTAEHPAIRTALLELKAASEEPLLAALSAPEPIRVAAMTALARMKSRKAFPLLVGPALADDSPVVRETARRSAEHILGGPLPGPVTVQNYLLRELGRVRGGQHAFHPDEEGIATVYYWDSKNNAPAARELPLEDAVRQTSTRLADEISRLTPERVDLLRLRLLHALDFWQAAAGLDKTLPPGSPPLALAERLGPAETALVLQTALEQQLTPAAIAAVHILGSSGDLTLLEGSSGQPTILATALTHVEPRVRLAAALATAKLQPQELFSGQAEWIAALTLAMRSSGRSRVLVADARSSAGQTLVGMCEVLGYSGREAPSGREAFRIAAHDPDYDAVLISDAIDFPQAYELVQLFRRDHRTARLPIALLLSGERIADARTALGEPGLSPKGLRLRERTLESAQEFFSADPLTYVAPQLHDEQGLAAVLEQLQRRAGRNRVPTERRVYQAQAALAALTGLARSPALFGRFDLIHAEPDVIAALSTPGLTSLAAEFLAESASPKAQTALVQLAAELSRPLGDRQAAAAAFAGAVKKRGLLLTQKQILAQYDRYNAGAQLPADSLAILSRVLDVMEAAPALAAARDR